MDLLNAAKDAATGGIKQEALEKVKELSGKNDDLLEAIESIQSALGTFSSCLSIKQCFGFVKGFTVDKKIEGMKPKYDEFKSVADKLENQFNGALKPIIRQIPEVEDLLDCIFKTKRSCDKIVNGGQELELEDLTQALDTVHNILSNKSKPMIQKIESKLQ